MITVEELLLSGPYGLLGAARATLHCRRSPAHCALASPRPPPAPVPRRASPRLAPASRGAGPQPGRGEARSLITRERSGTAIESGRELLARRAGRRSS
ncbi:hypothetical protein RR46_15206 [Papilio xuthus]|uniref:Uncharacterized protein n=1 Tax=Papilio xuthus TaxID=66420 RepID=A0A194PEK5_PAPXU|nr:hypothetical protein RR46_15206 [Papilio xuthus]